MSLVDVSFAADAEYIKTCATCTYATADASTSVCLGTDSWICKNDGFLYKKGCNSGCNPSTGGCKDQSSVASGKPSDEYKDAGYDNDPCSPTWAKGAVGCHTDGNMWFCGNDNKWYKKTCGDAGCDATAKDCITNAPVSDKPNTYNGPYGSGCSNVWNRGSYGCDRGNSWYCGRDNKWYQKPCGNSICATDGMCLDGYELKVGAGNTRKNNVFECVDGNSKYYDDNGYGYVKTCGSSGCDSSTKRCVAAATSTDSSNNAGNTANSGGETSTGTTPCPTTTSGYSCTSEPNCKSANVGGTVDTSKTCTMSGTICCKTSSGNSDSGNSGTGSGNQQVLADTPKCVKYSLFNGKKSSTSQDNKNVPEICLDTPILDGNIIKYRKSKIDVYYTGGSGGSQISETYCSGDQCKDDKLVACSGNVEKISVNKYKNLWDAASKMTEKYPVVSSKTNLAAYCD